MLPGIVTIVTCTSSSNLVAQRSPDTLFIGNQPNIRITAFYLQSGQNKLDCMLPPSVLSCINVKSLLLTHVPDGCCSQVQSPKGLSGEYCRPNTGNYMFNEVAKTSLFKQTGCGWHSDLHNSPFFKTRVELIDFLFFIYIILMESPTLTSDKNTHETRRSSSFRPNSPPIEAHGHILLSTQPFSNFAAGEI